MSKIKYSLNLDFFGIGVKVEFEEEKLYQEMKRRWFEGEVRKPVVLMKILGKDRSHKIISGSLVKSTDEFKEKEIGPDFDYKNYINWLVKVVLQARLIKWGVLFLHAGGVVVGEDEVVSVVGRSGAGKSTFVGNFPRERVIGDDIVALKVENQIVRVVRVWEKHKKEVGFKSGGRLSGILSLSWGNGIRIKKTNRLDILQELVRNTYWFGDEKRNYLKWSLRLLRRVRVGRLEVGSKFEAEKFVF